MCITFSSQKTGQEDEEEQEEEEEAINNYYYGLRRNLISYIIWGLMMCIR